MPRQGDPEPKQAAGSQRENPSLSHVDLANWSFHSTFTIPRSQNRGNGAADISDDERASGALTILIITRSPGGSKLIDF